MSFMTCWPWPSRSNDPSKSSKPIGLKWRSNTLFILGTVAIGMFTDLFLYGIAVPVLPFLLHDRIGFPRSAIQNSTSNLIAAYAVASVVVAPFAGWFGDKTTSRRAPFISGLLAMISGTVLFFTGASIEALLIARLLQGASSAIVWTVGLAMVMDTVGSENLGKAVGSILSFIACGELFAPIIGGVLYRRSGVNSVLALSVSVLAIDLVMRMLVIEKRFAKLYEDCDAVDGINQSSEQEDVRQHADGANEGTPLLNKDDADDAYLVPPNQPKIIQQFPILYCATSSSFVLSQLVTIIQAILVGSFDATVPTHALDLFNFDSQEAGLLFAPIAIVNLAAGPLAGWCCDRFGTKPLATAAYIYLIPALMLLRIPQSEPRLQQSILYGCLLGVVGIGMAGINAPSIVESGAVVEKFHKRNPEFFGVNGPYAQLYGLGCLNFSLGLSVGPILAGYMKDAIGYGNMNAVLAGTSAVTAVCCFIWLGKRPKQKAKAIEASDI